MQAPGSYSHSHVYKAILHQCHANIWSERMPSALLLRSSVSTSFLCIPALPSSSSSSSSILFLQISLKMLSLQPYQSPRLILKHCRGGDRNYQSEVHKFLSSSRNALRSSFYILLLPRRHKSPGSAQQHLLHSPPPRKPSPASPVSSPLSEICLFWTFFFFFHSGLMPSL